ncbi:hypothetical protein ABMA28_009467 [Loxostege sticticalis]|uniref:Uncharacterized protein n=1 Tax=Loxostege sticticalis TaxID=481309 RepID=A0ABD0SDE1_LOXSC
MTKLINRDAARLNPCIKEQEQSYQCLNKNGFDHAKCEGKVYQDRKSKGLQPYMPNVDDRERIKEEYKKSVRFE